ncbi:hypothetical protein BDR05DRAFT_987696 [Suillus weaverae]|nr:hypothetical protein BDR05DRAFT_987696 [Suillus weaverae]
MTSNVVLSSLAQLGQEVEIHPRIVTKHTRGRHRCKPTFSKIISLHAASNHLQFSGRLIGRVLDAIDFDAVYMHIDLSILVVNCAVPTNQTTSDCLNSEDLKLHASLLSVATANFAVSKDGLILFDY